MTAAACAKERSGINFTCRDLALQLVQVRCCWFQSQKKRSDMQVSAAVFQMIVPSMQKQ